jgi:transposase
MDYYKQDVEIVKLLYAFLKKNYNIRVKNKVETILFLEAVYEMVRSAKPWRMLHKKYGKWNTVFKRFRRWSVLGIFQDFQQNIIGLKKENNSND